MLLSPVADASIFVQGFLRVHHIAVESDRLCGRSALMVATVVVERSIPGQLVGDPIVRSSVFVCSCLLDDVEQFPVVHVFDYKVGRVLL